MKITIDAPELVDALNFWAGSINALAARLGSLTDEDMAEILGYAKKVPAAEPENPKTPAAESESETPAAEPEQTAYTYDDVFNALQSLREMMGRETAKKVLADMGVVKVSALVPEQYAQTMALIKRAMP